MQKWEYATIGLLNSYGLQYKLNGEKQNHWKDHPLHEVLRDMGEQSWELISYDGENYLFKRPKIGTGEHASVQQHTAHLAQAAHAPQAGHAVHPQPVHAQGDHKPPAHLSAPKPGG